MILTAVYCVEQPEQVHLSYGDSADQMVVLWSTGDYVHSAVYYGETQDQLTDKQISTVHRMHRAVMKGLKAKTKYYYKVLSNDKTSTASTSTFSFTTMDTTVRSVTASVNGVKQRLKS